jgi:membrane protein DedA with SNARE-associated domain
MSDWIVSFVGRLGSLGVFLLMLLENVFPPIPSELIMPLAGYHARTGQMNLWVVIVAGSLGSLAGTSLWYVLGRRIGEERLRGWIERHGKWLTITTEELDRSKAWFDRRGKTAVVVCRMIPALRTVISLPAGVSGMPLPSFLLYSSVGTLLWTAALAYAGYLLGGAYEQVSGYLGPASWVIIGTSLLIYVWRLIRQFRS